VGLNELNWCGTAAFLQAALSVKLKIIIKRKEIHWNPLVVTWSKRLKPHGLGQP